MTKLRFNLRDYRPRERGGGNFFSITDIDIEMDAVPPKGSTVVFPADLINGANPGDIECLFEVIDVEFYPLPSEIMAGVQVFLRCGRTG